MIECKRTWDVNNIGGNQKINLLFTWVIYTLICFRSKYCAVINNFGDPEETAERLRAVGCINVAESFYLKNETRNAIDKFKH